MVYQITREDIARSSTLEDSDMGRYYIVFNGTIQFVTDKESGRHLWHVLCKDRRQF